MQKFIILALSSFFGLGLLPLVPGTFGSLGGVLLFYLLKDSITDYLLFTSFLTFLGFVIAGPAERMLKRKDPSSIVIDEVCGMLLSLIFLPYNIKIVILGFFLFRILDTLKPYPAGRLQNLKGSLGIMSDDLLAGLYTNIILQVVIRLVSF